ncbi:filamentous hemagglutinin family N-terminal domain protein [Rivularia sp. PCC 7116]|uniref:beta strand repeat-containing protein n=1 Tax=Rivularia sp. PCC 7116 TaxID=373994 RepID=UPI00029F183D|nr:filamentous hemagglutinin N-terminal domain-containing protein [Rivularia sp. PCC 7116]AFY55547.1 filamentous hemagglutinin family N-terminal domain protein [Rivularia sp. PCC 7116]
MIRKSYLNKCLQLGLAGIASCTNVFLITKPALAQQSNITPDNTLGAESSRLNRNVTINGINADRIDGGARRDINLFHSFSEFNINDGQAVYFANPDGVENILTRVTGGNASNILGTLGVDGAANLFLINPNGIVFGENASLDLQGSFVGTTASGLQFGEQGNFSATNPELPGNLTINPSALFFNQVQASGGIINKSQASAGINPNGNKTTGLRVPDGKSLLLVGGNINFDGGRLRAYEGNIELASVTSPGSVGLDISGNTFRLNVPEDVERGDISLANESDISVLGAGGGNFTINARNLEISDSIIFAGIAENSDNPNAQAGDVKLDATGSILLKDSAVIDNSVYSQGNAGDIFLQASNSVSLVDSAIANDIEAGAVGNGGNINITAGSLSLTDGSEIQALLRGADVENNLPGGQGNAGNIFLEASNSISLVDRSLIVNNIEAGGVGKGGNINIKAASLSVTDGSSIQAILGNADVENNLPGGQGNLGNIDINVRDAVTIAGIKDGFNSEIFNFVGIGAIGNAGDININTDSLSLANGSEINAKTSGQGNAGNININARQNISLDGSGDVILSDGSNGTLFTRIINSVDTGAVGNAGNIQLNTGNLSVTNGAFISSSTNGKGDSGNITINASDTISFDTNSSVDTRIFTGGIGKGGDIRVKTGTITLTNGSQLGTTVTGEGNAGNIFVEARDGVKLDGFFSSQFNGEPFDKISGIESNLVTGGVGKGGDIQIVTKSLSVSDRASISATSGGQGDAGNININVTDTATFDNLGNASSVFASDGVGNGGTIRITAGELLLTSGGNISTNNNGQGNAGDVFLDVRDTISFDGVANNGLPSGVKTFASNGDSGDVDVKTSSLLLTNTAQISTIGAGQENSNNIANGGDIKIDARDTIKLDGVNTALISSLLRGIGKGGDIQIATGSLSVTDGAQISAYTSGRGDAGNININARDTVTFDGIGSNNFFSSANSAVLSNAVGNGSNITINTKKLFVTNGALLNTFSFGQGNAGNIFINAIDSIILDGVGNNNIPGGIQTFTFNNGDAGEIQLTTGLLSVTNGAQIITSTNGEGDAGKIKINARDRIIFDGVGNSGPSGAFSTVESNGVGNAGDIELTTGTLSISNDAIVSVASLGKEDAGDITLQAGTLQLNNGFITAQTASTKGGNIDLQISELLLLRNGSRITTTAGNQQFGGDGGNIDINSKFIVSIPSENSDITANAYLGNGGRVNINSNGIFGIETQPSLTNKSDITASSEEAIAGETNINTDDTSSIQNSFTELSPNIDTDAIIANSCISRGNKRQENSFRNIGSGGLRSDRAGNIFVSKYATGEVRTVESNNPAWKKGDAIVEPQGLYRLKNGELLLSRECSD